MTCNSLSVFHKNARSHTKNIENLELLLDSTQIYFDVIAVTETRILKSKFPVTNINLTKTITMNIARLSHLQVVQCCT